jgi:hypothetical protein
MYSAKVVADSIGPSGVRLISVLCSYPLMVHAEDLRHRCFSFSVASNRAIPTRWIIRQVIDDPVVPIWFGKNQGGMSAREELTGWRLRVARWARLAARWPAIVIVWLMLRIGLHKQIANRILSPWQWVTVLKTGTDWLNFFALRCHPAAQPEMRRIAEMTRDAIANSTPVEIGVGGWHLPFVGTQELLREYENGEDDTDTEYHLCMFSAARCARISLLKQDERKSSKSEFAMASGLRASGHMSPFEHQAQALATSERVANLRGWRSLRSTIPNESDFSRLTNASS